MSATFGAMLCELRREANLTLHALASRVYVTRGYLSELEHARKRPSQELAESLDVALGAGGRLAQAAAAPTQALSDPWETADLVHRLRQSDVSPGALETLAATVDRLVYEYSNRDAADLRTEAHQWLGHIDGVLRSGRPSLAAHRELLVSAGWLATLIGSLEHDLALTSAARTTSAVAASLGKEAGHASIAAWAHELTAWIGLTTGDVPAALEAARAGQTAGGVSHASVQLTAHEAKALGRSGAAPDEVRAVLDRGQRMLDRLDHPRPNHFRPGPSKYRFLSMDAYRIARADGDAEQVARDTIDMVGAPAGARPSLMRNSEAWLTLGVVEARRGDLDAAVAHGMSGLRCGPRRSAPSLRLVAVELDAELRERWPGSEPASRWRADARRVLGALPR